MWNLLKRRGSAAQDERQSQPKADAAPSPKRVTCGKGQLLYKYLSERYAQRVVLKFSEIEDLLGFSLPEQARRQTRVVDGRRHGSRPAEFRGLLDPRQPHGQPKPAGPDRRVRARDLKESLFLFRLH